MLTQREGADLVVLSQVNDRFPILVFLSGMDGSELSLRNHFEALATVFDVRCFCIPGNDATSLTGLVQRLVALLAVEKQSQPDCPIYLCGESFGACLALEAVSCRPDLFDRHQKTHHRDRLGSAIKERMERKKLDALVCDVFA
ncbi:MAG: hypothetical protein AAFR24_17705, partial [Cyanobacteria bacterium J06627_3]